MKRNEQRVPFESLVGLTVKYASALDETLFGKIIYTEPAVESEAPDDTAWVYIESNNTDENIHSVQTPIGIIMYADLRISLEVEIDL